MLSWNIVPSWSQIESRIVDSMDYQDGSTFRSYLNEYVPSVALNIRRVESVRFAFIQAEWQATTLLRQRFSNLNIADVLGDLINTANQMAMIIAGGVLTGGTIGAGVGAFGAGAGAVPLGLAGAALGLQISTWILGVLGLASIAEFFSEGLPRIIEYYLEGINIAWEGPRGDDGLQPLSQDDPMAQSRAAHYIAMGHVEIIALLLSGIVAYITRGRGDVRALAHEMRASDKGSRLGQWIVKHEDNLKSRTDLQLSEPRKSAVTPEKQNPVTTADKPLESGHKTLAGLNSKALSNSANQLDPADKQGRLTFAGRALQKHGSRDGSAFSKVKGNQEDINAQGLSVVNEILNNPASTTTNKMTGRFGNVTDIIAPDGRGLRYDINGKFIGLLEPVKP